MESETQSASDNASNSPFPPTLWTMVLEASQADSPESAEALRKLCQTYHQPIHTWLLRRGTPPSEAEDTTQGFIEHLLERNRLRNFTRGTTKFRSFLLQCLVGFTRDEWRKSTAQKRGGGQAPIDLDELELGNFTDVDKVLDLDFAKKVHQEAMAKLALSRSAKAANQQRFEVLRRFIWGSDADESYAEIGGRLEMTANHVKKAVHDLRHDYHKAFRAVVSDIVKVGLEEEETRYLLTLLAESREASGL